MQQRIADRSMPASRNCLRFCLTWLCWDRARRSCVRVMMRAVRFRSFRRACPVSHKERTSAEVAVRSWQTVNAGFSPPPLLVDLRQKQMTDGGENQVTTKRPVIADLKMAQTKLVFFVLKAAFHMPAREGHVQQDLQRRPCRSVGNKILDLAGARHIARDDEPVRPTRQTLSLETESSRLGLPDHRPLGGVFDVKTLPGGLPQHRGIPQQVPHRAGRTIPGRESRELAGAAHTAIGLILQQRRSGQPSGKRLRDLRNVALSAILQRREKRRNTAIRLIEGQPFEPHAEPDRPLIQLEGDLPLRT